MSDEPSCDVLVVGAGPAGCTAALYAARAALETIMISPTELSGMMAEAPAIENFPGQVEAVPGREILERIRRQALAAGARHILEPAAAVDFTEPGQLTLYAGPDTHIAKAVIIATGAWNRADRIPGEKQLLGRGVARCVACDGPLFEDQRVIVVGEDQEAAEEALDLANIAEQVIFATPRRNLDFAGDLSQQLEGRSNITAHTDMQIERIVGEQQVEGAAFRDEADQAVELEADGVFLYLRGGEPATDFLEGTVDLDEEGFIVTDELCAASMPGVFAAGDVRSKQVRQAIVAAAEGCIAALQAARHVREEETVTYDRGPQKQAVQ